MLHPHTDVALLLLSPVTLTTLVVPSRAARLLQCQKAVPGAWTRVEAECGVVAGRCVNRAMWCVE